METRWKIGSGQKLTKLLRIEMRTILHSCKGALKRMTGHDFQRALLQNIMWYISYYLPFLLVLFGSTCIRNRNPYSTFKEL